MIIEFDPDPTATPSPTKTKVPAPSNALTRVKDIVGDEIKIGLPISSKNITIRGSSDIWYFTPDQALTVAHTILGYVNKITGGEPRYVVGTITHAEPTFLYAPEDEDAGAQL